MLVQVIYINFKIKIVILVFNDFKNMYEQYGGTIHLFNHECLTTVIADIKKEYKITNKYFRFYNFPKPVKDLKRSQNGQ